VKRTDILAKYEMFKLNKEFRRLYARGKSIVLPAVVIYYKKNNLDHCRIGVTASKKIGCAVKRNRAKRVILAAFRQILGNLSGNFDFIFVARVRTTLVTSTVLLNSVKKAFEKEGVMTSNEKNTNITD
jgi:ribonuclease P protein component